jgi:hypothetical protein
MVHALKIRGSLARVIEADQRTAVRTAVFECRDRSVIIAGDHNRHPPDNGRAPIAGIGYLVFEAEVIPDRAFENLFLFDSPRFIVAIRAKIVANAYLGRLDEARADLGRMPAIDSKLTIAEWRAFATPLFAPEFLELYVTGMLLAGLPEE